jgi:hypothetical protein
LLDVKDAIFLSRGWAAVPEGPAVGLSWNGGSMLIKMDLKSTALGPLKSLLQLSQSCSCFASAVSIVWKNSVRIEVS